MALGGRASRECVEGLLRTGKRRGRQWGGALSVCPVLGLSCWAPKFVLTHRSVWAEERRQTFKRPTDKCEFAVEDFREELGST